MTTGEFEFILCDVQDGVGTLSLNRPPVNVMHIAMLDEMQRALVKLAGDKEVRALVLRAEGRIFSAGVDVVDHTPERVTQMIPLFNRVCSLLADFPVPTIAAVQGHALGGGCELVLCCDIAYAATAVEIGQPEIQLAALAPIAALRLPLLVGYHAAADLLFTGYRLTAQDALKLGLISALSPLDEIQMQALDKAKQIAAFSRAALVLNKQALQTGFGRWSDCLPEVERLYLDKLMATQDAHEGLAAFLEKRPPIWNHK